MGSASGSVLRPGVSERAFLEQDDLRVGHIVHGDAFLLGERTGGRHAADDLVLGHGQELQAVRGAGEDDDAEVELVALELLADRHRGLFVHEDVEVGVAALEARKDAREEVGAHHRRHADLDGALLELLVVVDLEHGVLDVAQGELDPVEEDGALRRQRELFLAAVEELDAELGLELLDGDRDIRLGNTQAFRSAGDISQTAGHL